MLVISELVTNALRHGLGDVVVRASVDDQTAVCVSVTDSGAEQPRLLPPDPRRLGGVGLRIVDDIAASWGVVAIPRRQDGVGRHRRRPGFEGTRVRASSSRPLREETTVSATVLWIIAAVLVIAGIITLISGSVIWGIVLIVLGLLVGPGGVSIFRPRTGVR